MRVSKSKDEKKIQRERERERKGKAGNGIERLKCTIRGIHRERDPQ